MTNVRDSYSPTRARMSITAQEPSINLHDSQGDQQLIRNAFAQFPSGVTLLAVEANGEKHAMVASSFMVGVSLDPLLVAVAIQKSSVTWKKINKSQTIGISIFAQGQGTLTRQLASKDRASRFHEVPAMVNDAGAVFLEDAAMWFETSIYNQSDAGDHWMVLLEVSKLGFDEKTEPLLWHGSEFREFAPH